MQRLACLFLMICAACTSGSSTGMATLTGVDVKASAAEPFEGADATGNTVLGWNILLYKDGPGGDCLEGTVLAKISIFTNTPKGQAEQALLSQGGISIIAESPPTIAAQAVANMGAEGVGNIAGIVEITEFHLTPDAKHADRIVGTISAAGYDSADNGVALNGSFTAPICKEE